MSFEQVKERHQGLVELSVDGGIAFRVATGYQVYWRFDTPLGTVLKECGHFTKVPALKTMEPPSVFEAMMVLTPIDAIA